MFHDPSLSSSLIKSLESWALSAALVLSTVACFSLVGLRLWLLVVLVLLTQGSCVPSVCASLAREGDILV